MQWAFSIESRFPIDIINWMGGSVWRILFLHQQGVLLMSIAKAKRNLEIYKDIENGFSFADAGRKHNVTGPRASSIYKKEARIREGGYDWMEDMHAVDCALILRLGGRCEDAIERAAQRVKNWHPGSPEGFAPKTIERAAGLLGVKKTEMTYHRSRIDSAVETLKEYGYTVFK